MVSPVFDKIIVILVLFQNHGNKRFLSLLTYEVTQSYLKIFKFFTQEITLMSLFAKLNTLIFFFLQILDFRSVARIVQTFVPIITLIGLASRYSNLDTLIINENIYSFLYQNFILTKLILKSSNLIPTKSKNFCRKVKLNL